MDEQSAVQRRNEAGPSCSEAIPPESTVQEADLCSLRVGIGCSGVEAFRVSTHALRAPDGLAALAVLDSDHSIARGDAQDVFDRAFEHSSSLEQTAARFLRAMGDGHSLATAFLGLWQEEQRRLTYSTAGLGIVSVINIAWPRAAQGTVIRTAHARRGELASGAQEISQGERWLLYGWPLVEAKGAQMRAFDPVSLERHACDCLAMSNAEWLDHLLSLALDARDGSLHVGSVLVSLVIREAE